MKGIDDLARQERRSIIMSGDHSQYRDAFGYVNITYAGCSIVASQRIHLNGRTRDPVRPVLRARSSLLPHR